MTDCLRGWLAALAACGRSRDFHHQLGNAESQFESALMNEDGLDFKSPQTIIVVLAWLKKLDIARREFCRQDRPGRYSSGRLDCLRDMSKGNRSLTLSESGVHVVERGICGFIRVLRTMIVDVCTQDSTLHRIVAGAADGAGTSISTAVSPSIRTSFRVTSKVSPI